MLAAGDSATITYTVTYHEGNGDAQLDNAACIPADEALDPADRCTTVRVPGSGLEQTKRSDPPSGTSVDAGDEITYTLKFSNTGEAPADVETVDDVSDVLDDAELIAGPTADFGLTATPPSGGQIQMTGTVPVGEDPDRDLHGARQGVRRPGRPHPGERPRLSARRSHRM